MDRDDLKPFLALLAVQFSFASNPVFSRIVLEELSPVVMTGLRIFGAALFLVVLGIWRDRTRPPMTDLAVFAGLSVLGVSGNQLLFITGLSLSNAVNAVILAALIPIWTQLLAIVVRQEEPRAARLVGIGIGLAGALILLGVEDLRLSSDTLIGNLCFVGNTFIFSCYLVFSRPILKRYRSSTVTAWVFFFAAVGIAPFALLGARGVDFGAISGRAWGALLYIILFSSVLAYSLNAYALKRIRSSTVATFIFLQPLIGVGLALLILPDEAIGPRTIVAGLLILVGLVVVSRTERVEPLVAIPESGEAISRQPIEGADGGTQPQPQEDHRRGERQEAP